MKAVYIFLSLLFSCFYGCLSAQVSGTFQVKGDVNTYYPVTFYDGGWSSNMATELELGRSDVHTDGSWRGALIAKFTYHTDNWGNKANFINSEMQTNTYDFTAIKTFVGGYGDVTSGNADKKIVIWLRGGTTTYAYKSNYAVTPTVYDGVQNALPYTPTNGTALNSKTTPDPFINQAGLTYNSAIYTNGIVIGATAALQNPNYKLNVFGDARANKVVVNTTGADFVFDSTYDLKSLDSVETYIKQNKHLPEIASADEMQKEGLDVGTNQTKLLQKIEELTLYIIEQNKKIDSCSQKLVSQDRIIKEQEKRLQVVEQKQN